MVEPTTTSTLVSLQYLRAVAALLVVAHHTLTWGDQFAVGASSLGQTGVDLFFVLSGFIMVQVARRDSAHRFALMRVVRVVPLYWIATSTFLLLLAAAGRTGPHTPGQYLQSLLFIPHFHPTHAQQAWPLLIPGWTLNYEMLFYALFAVGLLSGRPVLTCTAAIIALVLAGLAVPMGTAPYLTYTSPLMLQFLAGMLLGLAFNRFAFERLWVAGVLGIVLFASLSASDPSSVWALRLLAATGIVAGALSMEVRGLARSRLGQLLGDASYSIYLWHIMVLAVFFQVLAAFESTVPVPDPAVFAAAIAVSAATGVFSYLYLERPLLAHCRRLVDRVAAKGGKPIAT